MVFENFHLLSSVHKQYTVYNSLFSTGAAMVLKKTVIKLLPIEIHVTLSGIQATHKPTLLLPQSCLTVVSLLGSVWNNSDASPADLHWCS